MPISRSRNEPVRECTGSADPDDAGDFGALQRSCRFGHGASGRHDVVDQPDPLREEQFPTGVDRTAYVAVPLMAIQTRLAGSVACASECHGIEGDSELARQISGE